jgi:hypothetical protein
MRNKPKRRYEIKKGKDGKVTVIISYDGVIRKDKMNSKIIDEELHASGFFKSVHVDEEREKLTAIKTSTTKKKYAEMKNILNELEKRINRASRQETY